MFEDNKNLKDASHGLSVPLTDTYFSISYTKSHKLITALYMVTEIMDKSEPIRFKLRTLGMEIISDMYSIRQHDSSEKVSFMLSKVAEIMSFLDIASAINLISEMNSNILKKEFSKLSQSIKESNIKVKNINKQINLSEFLKDELPTLKQSSGSNSGHDYIRHSNPINIGLQKGSTLLKALSETKLNANNTNVLYDLRLNRSKNIINVIKLIGQSATIKDIKDNIKRTPGQFESLVYCSEKTLQRELTRMVRNGVLKKTGEKRWSRYQLSITN